MNNIYLNKRALKISKLIEDSDGFSCLEILLQISWLSQKKIRNLKPTKLEMIYAK